MHNAMKKFLNLPLKSYASNCHSAFWAYCNFYNPHLRLIGIFRISISAPLLLSQRYVISNVISVMSNVMRVISNVKCVMLHFICVMSIVKCLMLNVICVMSNVKCVISNVKCCQMSNVVKCRMPCQTRHDIYIT